MMCRSKHREHPALPAPLPAGNGAAFACSALVSVHYRGYTLHESNGRGGKAGTGHNVTATIQIREPLQPGSFLLKGQVRYKLAQGLAGRMEALRKAKTLVDTMHANGGLSGAVGAPKSL